MSDTVDIAPMLEALWPPGEAGKTEVYAVMDGARDRRIEYLLLLWGLEHECLYGAVGPELRNAAPFLVRLERDGAGTVELLRESTGQDWGVFAVAPARTGMRAMTRHCRRLLRVLDEAGELMLFRYYDPRALLGVWQTCSTGQREEILGPVLSLVLEPIGSETALVLSRN